MHILRQPKSEPDLTPFFDGVAEIKLNGQVVGHIATSVSKFWSPFNPLSLNWWVWSAIVWADGKKEQGLEDYSPWSYVADMKNGKLNWQDTTYDIQWLSSSQAKDKYKQLKLTPEDF